jgi:hypothetical protein
MSTKRVYPRYYRFLVDNEYLAMWSVYPEYRRYTTYKTEALRVRSVDLGLAMQRLEDEGFNMSLVTAEGVNYLTVSSDLWEM